MLSSTKIRIASLSLLTLSVGCQEPVTFEVQRYDDATSTPARGDAGVSSTGGGQAPVGADAGVHGETDGESAAGDVGSAVAGAVDATLEADGEASAQADVTSEIEETPDEAGPVLRSPLSNKQGTVTARFSEPVAAGAGELANYTIRASNLQELPIQSATLNPDAPIYVDLAVDVASIDPDLSYDLIVKDVEDLAGNPIALGENKARVTRTLFLNIVWHQHQPLYLDPISDELSGPWVRKHATKDYYDMTSILEGYPDVHVNVNLTSVLLRQLLEYYVERMDPFIDVHANTMDVEAFMAAWEGKTDPFVDFTLRETPSAETITEEELLLVWKGPWTLVSTADAIMQHFPEYVALRDANRAEYDTEDFLALKIWFQIAWFDPDFLRGPVTLPDGSVTRVHEWLNRDGEIYTLAVPLRGAGPRPLDRGVQDRQERHPDSSGALLRRPHRFWAGRGHHHADVPPDLAPHL